MDETTHSGQLSLTVATTHADVEETRAASSLLVARLLLVVALLGSVWFIYRRLPVDAATEAEATQQSATTGKNAAAQTTLRVVVRMGGSVQRSKMQESSAPDQARRAATQGEALELYSIDLFAAEREFLSERRAGMRLEDFVRERTRTRPVVVARFDSTGAATLSALPGRWWVHARHVDADTEWLWRVPINLTGRSQLLELTPENAYTHTQSY